MIALGFAGATKRDPVPRQSTSAPHLAGRAAANPGASGPSMVSSTDSDPQNVSWRTNLTKSVEKVARASHRHTKVAGGFIIV